VGDVVRAVVVNRWGGPDTLEIEEMDEPKPAAGQISIDVAYAGVNFAEVMGRRGQIASLKPPFVPGLEVSGTVRAIGEGVAGLEVGDPVAAFTGVGGYAQVAVADIRRVIKLTRPAGSVDLRRGAALPTTISAAVALVEDIARVRAGESILVHAAAGSIGLVLGQLLKARGASPVVGVVGSPEKLAVIEAHGYDHGIVRSDAWPEDARLTVSGGFGVVFDSVGGPARRASFDLLRSTGRLVVFGNASAQPELQFDSGELRSTSRSVLGFSIGPASDTDPGYTSALWDRTADLLAAGAIDPPISEPYRLEDVQDIHRALEGGATTGKMIISLSESA
jgi:NADPH2:quinone reductase